MVSYADLTDRAAVDWAMTQFDRLGRETFLHEYGYGEAKEYFVITETGRYDSKAIFAAAFQRQRGVAVAHDEISGGRSGAAGRLVDLGYVVEGIDEVEGRLTFATFGEALRHFRIPLENHPAVYDFLSSRQFTEFYIPRSGSYIAAVPEDGISKAYINSGYIWHRVRRGEGETIELPVNRLRGGGYWRKAAQDQPKALCSTHFVELSITGDCSLC